MRACVHACMRACVHACVRVCVCPMLLIRLKQRLLLGFALFWLACAWQVKGQYKDCRTGSAFGDHISSFFIHFTWWSFWLYSVWNLRTYKHITPQNESLTFNTSPISQLVQPAPTASSATSDEAYHLYLSCFVNKISSTILDPTLLVYFYKGLTCVWPCCSHSNHKAWHQSIQLSKPLQNYQLQTVIFFIN